MVEGPEEWVVASAHSTWTLSRTTGRLTSWRYKGIELLDDGPRLNLWRAPTANELDEWRNPPIAYQWYDIGLDRLESTAPRVRLERGPGGRVGAVVEESLTAPGSPVAFLIRTELDFLGSGELVLRQEATPRGEFPDWMPGVPMWLPRIGVRFKMPDRFQNLQWFGRGPFETYPDRKTGARVGVFRGRVEEEYVPYLIPQEHGNRTDVRWLTLTGEDGIGLWMTGDDLQFSVHQFDQDNLFRALYPFQLRRDSSITVNLDHRVTGVGDTPVPTLPRYRIMPQSYRWTTCLRAFDGREVSAVELGRGGGCRARP